MHSCSYTDNDPIITWSLAWSVDVLTPQYHIAYYPHSSLYISYGTSEENLFDNQKLFNLVNMDSAVVAVGRNKMLIVTLSS